MKLLLVEDTKNKSEKIESFLKKTYSEIGLEIIKKESYHSASKEIFDHGDEYFVILLDMTMSTFDATNGENGGEPEPVAGKRILNGMYLRQIMTKVIVVTMHNIFGQQKLLPLIDELKELYPDNYYDYIFFAFNSEDWKKKLKTDIDNLINLNK